MSVCFRARIRSGSTLRVRSAWGACSAMWASRGAHTSSCSRPIKSCTVFMDGLLRRVSRRMVAVAPECVKRSCRPGVFRATVPGKGGAIHARPVLFVDCRVGAAIQRREVSPLEVTRAYLDRIQAVDGRLNSYISLTAERALEDAKAAEAAIQAGTYRGPLHGSRWPTKILWPPRGSKRPAAHGC